MDVSLFDYHLPPELIAQHPVEPRDHARLMVVDRERQSLAHHRFDDLPELLRPGDLLARNNSRVIPARLIGRREATGGAWEALFLQARPDGSWEVLMKTRGRPRPGESMVAERRGTAPCQFTVETALEGGRWLLRPRSEEPHLVLLDRLGQVPLPPYIRKGREGPGDREQYQTVYAQSPGSVAAPTAGLHFTEPLFQRLAERGVSRVDVTLHVGIGTFKPIETQRVEDYQIHSEYAEVTPEAANALNRQRDGGGRIIAVGTTTARILETAAGPDRRFQPFAGSTSIYITPGYAFRGVDALVTNFHLPRSSLLVLIGAFGGVDFLLHAYRVAVAEQYHFYSYGDAMLII